MSYLNGILGFRHDGRPIWAFSGAEGESGGDGGGDGGGGDGGTGGTGDSGGANGGAGDDEKATLLRSLEASRGDTRNARNELRGWKATLADNGITSPDQLKDFLSKVGSGTGNGKSNGNQDVDVEKIRADAEKAATTRATAAANQRIALAKMEAMATGKFADPMDAVNHFTSQADEFVGDDGSPDVKHIQRELESLLTQKPHWGMKTGTGRIDFDGGARQTATTAQKFDQVLRNESARRRGGL
jgi:hypothetical protein